MTTLLVFCNIAIATLFVTGYVMAREVSRLAAANDDRATPYGRKECFVWATLAGLGLFTIMIGDTAVGFFGLLMGGVLGCVCYKDFWR